MTCTNARLVLTRRSYEPLSTEEAHSLQRHIDGCEACRRHESREAGLERLLTQCRETTPVKHGVRPHVPVSPRRLPGAAPWLGAAALTMGAALTLLLAVTLTSRDPQSRPETAANALKPSKLSAKSRNGSPKTINTASKKLTSREAQARSFSPAVRTGSRAMLAPAAAIDPKEHEEEDVVSVQPDRPVKAAPKPAVQRRLKRVMTPALKPQTKPAPPAPRPKADEELPERAFETPRDRDTVNV